MSTYRGKRFRPDSEESIFPEIESINRSQKKHPQSRRVHEAPEVTPQGEKPSASSTPSVPKAEPSAATRTTPAAKSKRPSDVSKRTGSSTPPVASNTALVNDGSIDDTAALPETAPVSKVASEQASSAKKPSRRTRTSRAATEKPASDAPRQRVRNAAPDAFKHHDEAIEDGTSKRHSKRRTLLIALPIIIVVVAAFVAGGFALSNMLSEDDSDIEAGVPVTVVIPEGSSTHAIANVLKESQVIGNAQTFIDEVQNRGVEQQLMPGTYELETRMDLGALIDALVAGPLADGSGNLTIPEGLTVEQTAETVEASLGIAKDEFLQRAYAASDYVDDYPFLVGVYNNSLEGFLYPKTYTVPEGASADDVIRILLDQFAKETSELSLSYAEASNMNLFNVITIASLIEKETAVSEERLLVSSVIYNRLRANMMLQIDATVVYALGSSYDGGLLSYDDLEIDSPYNTYKSYELPAGPICSPSIESIEAAAHPAETEYLYYVVTSEEGYHTFCVTEEEFYAAKEEHDILFGIE